MCGGKEENTVTQLLVPARDYGNTELGFLSREARFYFYAAHPGGGELFRAARPYLRTP
jgi:hypothetical protein